MTSEALKRELSGQRPQMLGLLQRLVEHESPSYDKGPLDRTARFIANTAAEFGFSVDVIPQDRFGDHVVVRVGGSSSATPGLLLGHYDTVFDFGTLDSRPFRTEAGHAFGPGVLDMKSGLVEALFALKAVAGELARPVTLIINSDEEIGSLSSRELIERHAREAAYALVLEPSTKSGALKTARKGVGAFRVEAHGHATHAGTAHQRGRSAIAELAHLILELQGLTDYQRGVTVNVGVIHGGTRPNVVPDSAVAEVDLRVATTEDGERMTERILGLSPRTPDCTLTVTGGMNRPPMQRTDGTVKLLASAQAAAEKLGFRVEESAVGGGSDGNFTSALGVPTLDGLGAVGDGAHEKGECVKIDSIIERSGLVAQLLLDL
jgi:glutamate carboxypeptidase